MTAGMTFTANASSLALHPDRLDGSTATLEFQRDGVRRALSKPCQPLVLPGTLELRGFGWGFPRFGLRQGTAKA